MKQRQLNININVNIFRLQSQKFKCQLAEDLFAASFQLQPVGSGEQQGLWRQRDDTILSYEGLV